ncbi:hypothetical protein T12_14593 [Trichinella patagoniensis]|uniref:MULE transposase domain-containing protein n=1 Tax=Trichinella patagoniensis TaxID=990121 RepID=A0A0V0ZA79_9BILA|nr:hypothetical protein T12_14593 [Trichinella patagoniensis]
MDHKAAILVGYFPNTRVQGCYFHFCQAVHRKVGELGLKTRYHQHEETRRKIRMLLTTAFLPVPHVNTGEWMTDERLPLWNVHNVNIRTNNHLEGWHNRLNRKAGNVIVGDLKRVNKVYAQKQRQVAQYTGEYTNSRRTLEQFLEALMYITPEPI